MRKVLGVFAIAGSFLATLAVAGESPANADELIMPFACAVERGEVRLTASNDVRYRLAGTRSELAFSDCIGARCETLMVHKFAIECDGGRVAWSRVAAAGKALGVVLPDRLPQGYAPVSRLSGRFVMPSLARTETSELHVVRQDLSPDSVVEPRDAMPLVQTASWETVVKADFLPQGGGGAAKVAGVVMSLLAVLMAASLVVAGRWRVPLPVADGFGARVQGLAASIAERAWRIGDLVVSSVGARLSALRASSGKFQENDALAHAFLALEAQLVETELLVSVMPGDLLLKDVLLSEIATTRGRASAAFERRLQQAPARTSGQLRALHRDLDRIGRIARGAGTASTRNGPQAAVDTPQTIYDACRILGINADAPQAAIKKLVDALRVTWHPDHARDDADRASREERMKQINAAWDIVKDRRDAA